METPVIALGDGHAAVPACHAAVHVHVHSSHTGAYVCVCMAR